MAMTRGKFGKYPNEIKYLRITEEFEDQKLKKRDRSLISIPNTLVYTITVISAGTLVLLLIPETRALAAESLQHIISIGRDWLLRGSQH